MYLELEMYLDIGARQSDISARAEFQNLIT